MFSRYNCPKAVPHILCEPIDITCCVRSVEYMLQTFFFQHLLLHACKTESLNENSNRMPVKVSIPKYTYFFIYLPNSMHGSGMF